LFLCRMDKFCRLHCKNLPSLATCSRMSSRDDCQSRPRVVGQRVVSTTMITPLSNNANAFRGSRRHCASSQNGRFRRLRRCAKLHFNAIALQSKLAFSRQPCLRLHEFNSKSCAGTRVKCAHARWQRGTLVIMSVSTSLPRQHTILASHQVENFMS
jgi:hypothetical protein